MAISSTICERAEAFAGSAAWASLISTNRLAIARPAPAAWSRSSAAATTSSAPRTFASVGGKRPRERDQGIAGQQAGQVVQACLRGGEPGVERVERRPVDVEPGVLDLPRHGLEVGAQGTRLVDGGQVAEGRQRSSPGDQEQDDEARPDEDPAAPAPAARAAAAARGALRRRGPRVGIGLREPGIPGHVAGTAMTTNRGAVG